jgi:hypothetical protein
MKVEYNNSPFFYKTKNFAFSLSKEEISEINYIFKQSLKVCLRKDSFEEDTIWLDSFIKRNREQDLKLLCWKKMEKQEAHIINTNNNEQVFQIIYVTSHDYRSWYYQYFDYKTGLLIFEKKEPWIGCPPF